jgi:hypothetical protein
MSNFRATLLFRLRKAGAITWLQLAAIWYAAIRRS